MVRSSSVFLFVAQYYRKDRARMGTGQKIVCKLPIQKGKFRHASLPDLSCEAPEQPLFERNVQPVVNETLKKGAKEESDR